MVWVVGNRSVLNCVMGGKIIFFGVCVYVYVHMYLAYDPRK